MTSYFNPPHNCYLLLLEELLIELQQPNQNNKIIKYNLIEITLDLSIKLLTIEIIAGENIEIKYPIYICNKNIYDYKLRIIGSDNIKAAIIEHNQQQSETAIICKHNTILDYYLMQQQGQANITLYQHAYSKITARLLASNLHASNVNITVNLCEQHAKIDINILQHPHANISHVIELFINHLAAHTYSNTKARIIAAAKAIASLSGRIIVNKGCSKANANLQSKALVLDKHATVINRPELVIDHDDVICAHGASIGELDQEALFYMQTRGISLLAAKKLLLSAFKQPIIATIQYPEIINYIDPDPV